MILGESFSSSSIQEEKDSKLYKNQKLLQSLFFFLILNLLEQHVNENPKYADILEEMLQKIEQGDGSCNSIWSDPEFQCDILNELAACMLFNNKNPFSRFDFTKLGGNHFEVTECVLRLLYNFTRPLYAQKEGVINELNFVREQQRRILPCIVNTKKTNFNARI